MIWPRISKQDNNTFHIDWKNQDKRKFFKNWQERDNNYRNIVMSCSRAALVKIVAWVFEQRRSIIKLYIFVEKIYASSDSLQRSLLLLLFFLFFLLFLLLYVCVSRCFSFFCYDMIWRYIYIYNFYMCSFCACPSKFARVRCRYFHLHFFQFNFLTPNESINTQSLIKTLIQTPTYHTLHKLATSDRHHPRQSASARTCAWPYP